MPKKTAKKTAKKATKKAVRRKSSPTKVTQAKVSIGLKIPPITLPATGQKTVSLSDLKGRNVVLYFYPKDCTPGCTIEGHDFTKLHSQFKSAQTEVLGISRDTVTLHEKFKAKENYSFDLLSDADEAACEIFGVMKMKNMYGKMVRGIERSTFVIDKDGRLVKEWRKVQVEGHAQEVLDFVKSLS